MAWRPTRGETRQLRVLGIIIVAAALTAVGASPTWAASSPACRVTNASCSRTFAALQDAVDAANMGDRLAVRGVCHGGTVIDRDLVIEGVRTRRYDMPRLDGGTTERVIRVRGGVTVTMRRVIIERGRAPKGGGVWNQGTLILRDVVVRRNKARILFGGGVVNWGTLVLRGRSSIRANTVVGRVVPGYIQPSGGGMSNSGSLTLHDRSAIRGNTVLGHCIQGIGGGLDNSDGSVVLNDHSAISRNRVVFRCATLGGAQYALGGGVDLQGGSLTLNDASRISRNRIVARLGPVRVRLFGFGGGVYRYVGGSLTLNDHSSISHNQARMAGGVDARGDYSPLTMTGFSAIVGNVAELHGGGILHHRRSPFSGVTCGPGAAANVRQNRPEDCSLMVWRGR